MLHSTSLSLFVFLSFFLSLFISPYYSASLHLLNILFYFKFLFLVYFILFLYPSLFLSSYLPFLPSISFLLPFCLYPSPFCLFLKVHLTCMLDFFISSLEFKLSPFKNPHPTSARPTLNTTRLQNVSAFFRHQPLFKSSVFMCSTVTAFNRSQISIAA